MAKWNIGTVPKCEKGTTSDEVLVTIEKASIITGEIYSRVVKAVYIPNHNCSLEDLEWNVDDDILDGWEYTDHRAGMKCMIIVMITNIQRLQIR